MVIAGSLSFFRLGGEGQELATLNSPRRAARSNSLSLCRKASSHQGKFGRGFARRSDAQEVLAGRGSPLLQPGGSHRRPARLQGVVEHVAVGEVLDQETIRVAPVVEDLAALDVAADAPRAVIPLLAQVFAARGKRVEVADLIGRMHVATDRAQSHRKGVVVRGDGSAVAADEAHDRSTLALARVEAEIADDHARSDRGTSSALRCTSGSARRRGRAAARGGYPGRTLGGVGTNNLVAEVEHVRCLRGQRRELMGARHDA